MKCHPRFGLLSLSLALAGVVACPAPAATLSGATGVHDPSRMISCDGKYYVYGTGGGMKFSIDGVNWTAGSSPFAAATTSPGSRPGRGVPPASVTALLPQNRGIWAPDVIFYNHRYYLYYSVAAVAGLDQCAIGLLTSPTLDPTAPGYRWTDAGVVISTRNKIEKRSAIDPGPFVDAKGNLWLVWGSGYANGSTLNDPTIIVSKLDNATGLLDPKDTTQYGVAPGHIEAGYVHYRAGYYYAFWNDGGCCNGTSSTYRIHVARSVSPTGPYLDKAGQEGSGEIFAATNKDQEVYGPGHLGITSEPGLDRFTFHYYNAQARPVLGVRTLVWGADGWPAVGEDLVPGTYKVTADNGLALGVRGGSTMDGAAIELQPYTGSPFQKWAVTVTPEGYYRLESVGSGKSIEIAAHLSGAPAAIDQAADGTQDRQRWIVERASNGKAFRLKPGATHEVLALPVAATQASGRPLSPTTALWSNLPGQTWNFTAP